MKRLKRGLRWFAVWAWPLIASAGTIYAVWRVFEHTEFTPQDNGWILVGMGTAYLIAALFVLAFSRRWDGRSIGQIWTYLADAALYIGLGSHLLGWRHALTEGEQNMIRAAFVFGGPVLVLSLFCWVIRTRGGTRDPVNQPWVIPVTDPAPSDQLISARPNAAPPRADA